MGWSILLPWSDTLQLLAPKHPTSSSLRGEVARPYSFLLRNKEREKVERGRKPSGEPHWWRQRQPPPPSYPILRRDEYITYYRPQLGWTTHVDRRLYFAVTIFYKINQGGQPNYLANFFLRRVSNRPIRGDAKAIIIPKHNHEALGNSFHINTDYIWNSPPSTIRNSPTIASLVGINTLVWESQVPMCWQRFFFSNK